MSISDSNSYIFTYFLSANKCNVGGVTQVKNSAKKKVPLGGSEGKMKLTEDNEPFWNAIQDLQSISGDCQRLAEDFCNLP